MDIATTTLAERVARALVAFDLSANAGGVEASASLNVDDSWRDYLVQSDAVLRTIREPSEKMAKGGDVEAWAAMIDIAIEESEAL